MLCSLTGQGRALVWPSVKNEDPDSSDTRMYHEAMEVIKGTKYAANHWSEYLLSILVLIFCIL